MSLKRLPGRRSSASTMRRSTSNFKLLQLPVELILEIWNFLPLHCKCLLALTCKKLYSICSASIWDELATFPGDYHTHLSKSYVLRGIQKDRNDPSVYVCYTCLKFHQVKDAAPSQPRHMRNLDYTKYQIGYPNCRSVHREGIIEILRQLEAPNNNKSVVIYKTTETKGPVHMEYTLSSGIGRHDMFTQTTYTLKANESYRTHFMVPGYFLRTANLEICRHTWFGNDHATGDGSINDDLRHYYDEQRQNYFSAVATGQVWQPQPFSGYVCQECKLEVELRFRGMEVTVQVWQHTGVLGKSSWGGKVMKSMGVDNVGFEGKIRKCGLKPGMLRTEWEGLKHKGGWWE